MNYKILRIFTPGSNFLFAIIGNFKEFELPPKMEWWIDLLKDLSSFRTVGDTITDLLLINSFEILYETKNKSDFIVKWTKYCLLDFDDMKTKF